MVNSRDKGQRGEREFIEVVLELLGREKTHKDRRNNQATPWGGTDNSDVSIKGFERVHWEVKNEKTYRFPAYKKQVEADCPVGKTPVIAYRVQGSLKEWWINLPISKIEDFAVTWAQAFGYEVAPKGEGKA